MIIQTVTIQNTTPVEIGLSKIVFSNPDRMWHVANLSSLSGGTENFVELEYIGPVGNLTQIPANGSISFQMHYVYFGGGAASDTATVIVYGTNDFTNTITVQTGVSNAPTPNPLDSRDFYALFPRKTILPD